MSKPHQCPVCLGKGKVPQGFYNFLESNNTTTVISEEMCRSCNGEGIIWEQGMCCGRMNHIGTITPAPELNIPKQGE